MEIHRLPLPPLGANCYLLCQDGRGLILDPGGDAALVRTACRDLGMTPEAVALTHGHFDHVGAAPELLEAWPEMALWCHPADLAETDRELFPLPGLLAGRRAGELVDGARLTLAGMEVEVLHTPGHSRGSVCLRLGGALFTGDTLFRFSVGRTDLPGGDPAALERSLDRLAALDPALELYPGHDGATTLADELARNPYLTGRGGRG